MNTQRYTFTERKIYDALPDGKVRVYYDEVESTETVTTIDRETEEETTVTYPIYTYRAVDADSLTRSSIIVALIRADYSADDELAIQRQKDDKPSEYNHYNAFVEKCKAIADRTINGDTLATAKAMKIADLGIYDASEAVNAFYIGNQAMWLSPDRRSNLKNAVEALKASGVSTVAFMGQTIPVDDALAMLSAIESYAAMTTFVTDTHRAAIEALSTSAAVQEYDFTTGYPEKLNF